MLIQNCSRYKLFAIGKSAKRGLIFNSTQNGENRSLLQYNDIKLEDISFFEYYWKITSQRASDYSFPILWGWAGDYGYRTAREDDKDLLWIRQTIPRDYDLAPLGNWERPDWADVIRERFGDESEFWLVPEKLLKIWEGQFGKRLEAEDMRKLGNTFTT